MFEVTVIMHNIEIQPAGARIRAPGGRSWAVQGQSKPATGIVVYATLLDEWWGSASQRSWDGAWCASL